MITVVVPVRDAMPWLPAQLEALAAQEGDLEWEVVVADNGSTDSSVEVAREWSARNPRFRVVDASARLGPGAARNIGVDAARGTLLAFCDADDLVSPGWLAGMAAALERADVVAGVFDFCSLNGRDPVDAETGGDAPARASFRRASAPTSPFEGASSRRPAASSRSCSSARTSTSAGGCSCAATASWWQTTRWWRNASIRSPVASSTTGSPTGGAHPSSTGAIARKGPGPTWSAPPGRGPGWPSTSPLPPGRGRCGTSGSTRRVCASGVCKRPRRLRVFFP